MLLALLAAGALLLSSGGPRFGEGSLLVCADGGGTVELYWPAAADPAMYQVEVRWGEVREERYHRENAARLSGIPAGEELHVRIRAVADGQDVFGRPRQALSRKTLKADVVLPEGLTAPEVLGAAEAGALAWTGGGDVYEIFRLHDSIAPGAAGGDHVASTEEESWSPPPQEDARRFAVRSGWRRRGFVLCGPAASLTVSGGRDLPVVPLSLSYRETDPRMYVLEWDGTRCHGFEVQEWRGDGWETIARMAPEEHMRYDTGRLRSGSSHRFRVAARPDNALGVDIDAAEVSFTASVSPLYSTVWPIQDLTLYEDPGKGGRLASVPGGTALCVLAEEGDWFRVRYEEEYGWLDSRFCMIDLPEYVGDHCDYDITNSYRSLFAAHDVPIGQITGQVIEGFEDVRTADGEFLVPYLYPCAKKLLTAARQAEADGYRLKIYEAFRPQRATRSLYDVTDAQKGDAVVTADGRRTTLLKLMTDDGRFSLGSFLARTISAHNRGIALDLTLEEIGSGEELAMQSPIHDLSWYAAADRSNDNARLLAGYMTGVGMNGLSSEWWHFQDDATKGAIGLKASLYQGVSPEGWVQDDAGWRYRDRDGSFLRDAAVTIDGRRYTFGHDGYAAG
nr:M15 family metallopeptidase [uncultured Oscillibacter sp.]